MPIVIFLFFIIINIKYFIKYYEKYNLIFSKEEEFLFYLVVFSIIIFTIFSIYIFLDRKRLIRKIDFLTQQLEDTEDNYIWSNRDTQEMISNYFDEENEKK